MPLSKNRNAKRMWSIRHNEQNVQPDFSVMSGSDTLQSTRQPPLEAGNGLLPAELASVQPEIIGVVDGTLPDADDYYPIAMITDWVKFNGKVGQMQLPNSPDGRYH
jgi:hypothetical protein